MSAIVYAGVVIMGIGEVIKQYRKENDLSLREFAEKASLSHAYIDKLENGKDPTTGKPVMPTMRTIKSIAKAMGISTDDLMVAAGYIDKTDPPKPKALEGLDMFFMRKIGKMSPDGKKKVYDYIEMVDTLEKHTREKQNKKK
jgi:transcriptional regulator with XRE-family HTH domain